MKLFVLSCKNEISIKKKKTSTAAATAEYVSFQTDLFYRVNWNTLYLFNWFFFHFIILIFHKGRRFLTLWFPRHSINKLRKLRWYNQSFESYLFQRLFCNDKEHYKPCTIATTTTIRVIIMRQITTTTINQMSKMMILINSYWKK